MKKVLSILLSVLLLMGTCTVLTSVIASAATVKAEAGGTATVDGNTFVAKPYYGNSFDGWYDSTNNRVSTSLTYVSDATELTAKFNVYNQFPDGDLESGTTAVKDAIDSLTLHTPAKKRVIEAVNVPTGSDPTKHGEKMLHVSLEDNTENPANGTTYQRLFTLPLVIKPNTTYVFSYSYYQDDSKNWMYNYLTKTPGGWSDFVPLTEAFNYHFREGTVIKDTSKGWNFNYAMTGKLELRLNQNQMTPNAWHEVYSIITTPDATDAIFNGGTSATVYMNFGGAFNVTNDLWVDNLCFAEATTTAPVATTKATAEAGGMISLNGGLASNIVVYKTTGTNAAAGPVVANPYYANVAVDPYGATAKAYYGNTFNGWYNGDTLVTPNTTVSLNAGDNLTAKFNNINQITDGDFEASMGLASWQSNTTAARAGYYTGVTGLTGNGMRATIGGNCLMSTKLPVTVKKNTDYIWQFNFKINEWQHDPTASVYSVIAPMISETGAWGSWPKVESWKVTMRSLADGAVFSLTGSEESMDEQIKFEQLLNVFDKNEWIDFTLEFNTGDYMTADEMTYHMAMGFNNATGTVVDFDNLSFYEANAVNCVNFISKENVRAVPAQLGNAITGNNYSFTLEKDANVAVSSVKYNNADVTPVNGVYTITLTDSRDVTITLANDADYPAAGKDFNGFDLTTYNNAAFTAPVWEGNTVYHEAVYAYNGRTDVTLLYPIDKIVSVRSYDLSTYYVKGVDFNVVDGKLTIPAGSRLLASPYSATAPTTNLAKIENSENFPSDDEGMYVSQYSRTNTYNATFVVTYTHTETWDDKDVEGYTAVEQKSVEDELDVFTKLRNGDDVHIVFYGDSMTSGWSASAGKADVYTDANDGTTTSSGYYGAPYTPNWMTMFVEGLKAEYPDATITWENLSLGGKTAAWGAENFEARYALLNNKNVDLFLIGFGINDCNAGVTPAAFKASTTAIINGMQGENWDASILLYGANSTNLYGKGYDKDTLLGYEDALAEIAADKNNVAATKLTSIYMDINASKQACDYLENNFNHANDFGSRIYAQVILSAMSMKYTSTAATPAAPTVEAKTDASVTLVATNGYEYSMDGQNWQTSNVFTGLTGNTEYSFYQRVARTEDTFESAASAATKETTEYTVTTAPAAPVVQSKNDTTVVLVAEYGCEYSIDGQNWQTSNVFTGLDSNTEYTFYQRLAATDTALASPASQGTKETTDLPTPDAPATAPEVESKTETTVTLKKVDGYEYSLDGQNWQTSNVFTGLTAGSTYTFYQRLAATNDANASASSAGTTASTTAAAPAPGAGTGTGTGTSTGTGTTTDTGATTGTTSSTTTVPQTGDTNTVFVFAIVFVMALAGVAVSVFAMKKSKAR